MNMFVKLIHNDTNINCTAIIHKCSAVIKICRTCFVESDTCIFVNKIFFSFQKNCVRLARSICPMTEIALALLYNDSFLISNSMHLFGAQTLKKNGIHLHCNTTKLAITIIISIALSIS